MNQIQAVKTKEQREQVEAHLLEAGLVYYDIWKLGLNTALRISDSLSLTMADVKALDAADPVLDLKEGKTGKQRRIVLNKPALQVMQRRLAEYPKAKYLFQSEAVNIDRRRSQLVSRRSVARVFLNKGFRSCIFARLQHPQSAT